MKKKHLAFESPEVNKQYFTYKILSNNGQMKLLDTCRPGSEWPHDKDAVASEVSTWTIGNYLQQDYGRM